MEIKETCKFCNKTLNGLTEKQAKYYLLQHIISKHPEKVRVDDS